MVFPYDPARSTDQQNEFVNQNQELSAAKEAGNLYALATAFPGGFGLKEVGGIPVPEDKQGNVPRATAWGGVENPTWAVIIPNQIQNETISRWNELAGIN